MKDWQLYVFDWDGTLMDTTLLIAKGYIHAAKELGYEAPSLELALSTIGLNRENSIKVCCPECPMERMPDFFAAFQKWYLHQEAELGLVDGFEQLLKNMHRDGLRLAIATGKSRAGVKRVFEATGVGYLFEAVQTADTNFSKPNPAMLNALSDECGVSTDEMVMIGDSVLDMQMALNARSDCAAVSYGASSGEELRALATVGVAKNVTELVNLLGLQKYL